MIDAPALAPGRQADWRATLRRVAQRGLRTWNRLALWFSVAVAAVLITRFVDGDWGNFRRHAWYHVFVLAWVGALTYPVRSIGSREVLRFWLAGFFPATFIAYVLGQFSEGRLDPGNLQTAGVVPVVEEIAKVVPLILWTTLLRPRHRHGTLADFLVLGFASGAGFAFHEDALYSRVASSGFEDGLLGTLFPVFLSTSGQFAVAHGAWTALAAVGLGLVSLHRQRRSAVFGGAALILVAIVDHGRVNFRGDGADWLMSLTDDGRRVGWLLLLVVIAVVVHDARALRWATARDRLFPVPTLGGDIEAATTGTMPARVERLAPRQQYRRRRNATFIDLFAVRSRGVSAGDRTGVRRELELARDRVGIAPSAAPAVRRDDPTPPMAPEACEPASDDNSDRARVVIVAVAVVALLAWLGNRGGDDPSDAVVFEDPSPELFEEDPPDLFAEEDEEFASEPAFDFEDEGAHYGPVITEPVFLRWERSDQRGDVGDITVAIDGDREVHIQGTTFHYQDSTYAFRCFEFDTDDPKCFEAERMDTLAAVMWDPNHLRALAPPGMIFEYRRIGGFDAECAIYESDDVKQVNCMEIETRVQLLLENDTVDMLGSPLSNRVELVEWREPTEADFARVAEAIVAFEAEG